ncbi:hypothetical protein ACFW04_005118 [Cataglyphis niger]
MGLDPILPFRNYSSILKIKPRSRDDIFAQNDNSESEDDISFDDYTSSIYSDDFEENEYENYKLLHLLANNDIFAENNNFENENDHNVGNTMNNNAFGENGNEHESSYIFFTPTLENLKNVLYVALNPYFKEFEIEVVSCPCLTREPCYLAAAGLSGNTGILEIGSFDYFYPRPRTDLVFDIQHMLSRCNNDIFVIGSGFATQPFMPYNGHLTMNAVVSANGPNVINNSCIAYEIPADELILVQTVNDPNQIKCSLFGQFFFSDGKRGPVIKIRAKGRRSRSSIIMLIQAALAKLCQKQQLIGLGIVLVVNGGATLVNLLSDDFVRGVYNVHMDYYHRLRGESFNCINLIAVGALISHELMTFIDYKNNDSLIHSCSMFNALPNVHLCGNFFNDCTPDETEYIVYINIAQEKNYFM